MHLPLCNSKDICGVLIHATVCGCALHVNNIYYSTEQDYLSWFHVMVHNHMVISKAGLVDVTTKYFTSSR